MEDGDLAATPVAVPRAAPVAVARAAPAAVPRAAPAAVAAVPRSTTSDGVASDRRAAVADLIRAHGAAVLGFCIRVLGHRALAEEVRQQIFLEAFRDFDGFQGRASRRAWLFGIASHRCLDALRNQEQRLRWIQSDENAVINSHAPGTGPSEQLEHAQLTAALEECMKSLSPEVRMMVLMRFQTELTYEELAPHLATRADALQMRVTRALSTLRRCMEGKGVYDA